MKSSIDHWGNVTIEFNIQRERLAAPPVGGEERQYLPCEFCGELQSAATNAVAIVCHPCMRKMWGSDQIPTLPQSGDACYPE